MFLFVCFPVSLRAFLGDSHSDWGEIEFHCILICTSLIAKDSEHFSLYLLVTCISLKNFVFRSFAHLSSGLSVLSVFNFLSFYNTFWALICHTAGYNSSPHYVECLFALTISCVLQKLLVLLFWCYFLKAGFLYIAKTDLKLVILLFRAPKMLDLQRCATLIARMCYPGVRNFLHTSELSCPSHFPLPHSSLFFHVLGIKPKFVNASKGATI